MSNNYIVTRDRVFPIDPSISDCSFLVKDSDIELIMIDPSYRCSLLEGLGVDKVVISNLGKFDGNVYDSDSTNSSKVLVRSGVNKWKEN